MDIKIICNLNPNYKHGNQVLDTNGVCICLTEAMGAGGHIPLILIDDEQEYRRQEDEDLASK